LGGFFLKKYSITSLLPNAKFLGRFLKENQAISFNFSGSKIFGIPFLI